MSKFSDRFTKWKQRFVILTFIGLSLLWVVLNMFHNDHQLLSMKSLARFIDNVLASIVLWVLAESTILDQLVRLTIALQISRIKSD